jgi:hypothetical protein
MRIKICISIFIILFLSLIKVYSQTPLPAKVKIGLPYKYYHPDISEVNSNNGPSGRYMEKAWIVLSDRDNNQTYNSDKASKFMKLSFGQKLYVAEEEGEYIHIFSDVSFLYPVISENAKDYGWIKKEYMLLNTVALFNPQNIQKKVVILDRFVSQDNYVLTDVDFNKHPGILPDFKTGNEPKTLSIYFVYKIDNTNKTALLAKEYRIQGDQYDIRRNLLGWVPLSKVTEWDHRICLEYNWDEDAVNERYNTNIRPTFFGDRLAAQNFYKSGTYEIKYRIIEDNNSKQNALKRTAAYRLRFPILSLTEDAGYNQNNFVYHVGIRGGVRKNDVDTTDYPTIRHKIDLAKKKLSQINIVFVIDGTKSMEQYFAPIVKAIEQSVIRVQGEQSLTELKFGAVVYRDFAEGRNLFEYVSLGGSEKVTRFLSRAWSEEKNKNDLDPPEAMYYGLNKALEKCKFVQGQSNYIVLVGDAGNHNRQDQSQVKPEEIVKLLVQYQVGLICYQANNREHESYIDYVQQCKNLILWSSNMMRKQYTKFRIYGYPSFEMSKIKNNAFVQSKLNEQTTIGSLIYPSTNGSIPTDYLSNEIYSQIVNFNTRISKAKKELEELLIVKPQPPGSGNDSTFTELSPEAIKMLRESGVSETVIKRILEGGRELSFDAYTTFKIRSHDFDLFKHVLFLTSEELTGLRYNLSQLDVGAGDNTSNSVRADRLCSAWKQILEAHTGTLDDNQITNLTIKEAHQLLFNGIPYRSNLLANVKLKEICDNSIEQAQLERYIDQIIASLNVIRKIADNPKYDGRFEQDGKVYYWIPAEILP